MRSFIIAFACGVAVLQVQGELPPPAFVCLLAFSGFAIPFVMRRLNSGAYRLIAPYIPAVSGFLMGFSWALGMAHYRLSDALPEEWETRTVQITGVVAALPVRFAQGERFVFDVESILTQGARVPGRIMLSWYRPNDEGADSGEGGETSVLVRPGERWQFSARLKRPHGNANPYGGDYEAWLLERGIRATGSIYRRGENKRLDAFVPRPPYIVQRLRDRIRQNFFSALPGAPYAGVLAALAMGDQRSITQEQWDVFRRAGITHLISISGLHVTMVGALFGLLVNKSWRRGARLTRWIPAQKAALAAAWLAAFLYSLLAGFEVPAQRTLYMLTAVMLSLVSGKNFGAAKTLLLALLAVLILDPWAVLSPGFFLSFGAVAVLFFVGSARAAPRRGWRKILMEWGVAQWGATLGTLPLLLFFFQQFSLVSPLANALAIPFVSFLVTPLALLFALFPWTPLLALDHWLFEQLARFIEMLAAWPVWQQAAPPLWAVPLAFLGLAWLLLPRGFPGRWTSIFLLFPALFVQPERPAPGEAWAEVLDVGQGLSVVVRTAEHTLLYDTGPAYSPESNAGTRVLIPFLRASGIRRIDAMIVSHRDNDHAGGMDSVRAAFPVLRLLSSMDAPDGERCFAGQTWEWDGVRFSLLHPSEDDYIRNAKKSNSLSCVLSVSAKSGNFLLTGDIESADEKRLIARFPAGRLRSAALLVPHHGSRGSSSPAFIAAVAPEAAVFSAGYRNRFGHPRPEILARYGSSRVWRTDLDGALRLRFADSFTVTSWRQERRRYWHGR
ncbi:MAG: DNA internalization-related competence protein ComEC/Rec2 [Candidatus Accumulibacter sp.]|jgi:competence protein ComEC|nr:DNA internalization-related competence protein ComEC/Rec2 [Accumulibacter sp.]